MRSVKKLLSASVNLLPRYELQCRYGTRRIVCVAMDDPHYARDTPGAPKTTVLAGIARDTGLPFVEGPALNAVCTVKFTPTEISEMEQEMAAVLR